MRVRVVKEHRRGGQIVPPDTFLEMDWSEAWREIRAGRVVPVTKRQTERDERETRTRC